MEIVITVVAVPLPPHRPNPTVTFQLSIFLVKLPSAVPTLPSDASKTLSKNTLFEQHRSQGSIGVTTLFGIP